MNPPWQGCSSLKQIVHSNQVLNLLKELLNFCYLCTIWFVECGMCNFWVGVHIPDYTQHWVFSVLVLVWAMQGKQPMVNPSQ